MKDEGRLYNKLTKHSLLYGPLSKASPEDGVLIVSVVLSSKHLGDRRNVLIKTGLNMCLKYSFLGFRESSPVKRHDACPPVLSRVTVLSSH